MEPCLAGGLGVDHFFSYMFYINPFAPPSPKLFFELSFQMFSYVLHLVIVLPAPVLPCVLHRPPSYSLRVCVCVCVFRCRCSSCVPVTVSSRELLCSPAPVWASLFACGFPSLVQLHTVSFLHQCPSILLIEKYSMFVCACAIKVNV